MEEEPDIKLSTYAGSWRKQRNSRETASSASLTMPNPLTVWITTNCVKFLEGNMRSQAGIKIVGRNINNLRYAYDTTLKAESEEERASWWEPLDESEKTGLKLNMQKTNIMASGPIISCQIEGETWEWLQIFIPWASKSLRIVATAMKFKDACSSDGKLWQT